MFNVNPETQPNGFFISFQNGYAISVQWGQGNYCSNRDVPYMRLRKNSETAEVAVYDPSGSMADIHDLLGSPPQGMKVMGWVPADELAGIMMRISSL